jgi:hypothetical protein
LGMIQCQNPVSVGWGDYVVAWLLTYGGVDCDLWKKVLQKCLESELCRKLIDLLPTIGYDIVSHKCYDLLDADTEITKQAPKQPNSTSTKPTTKTKANQSSSKRLSPRSKQLPKLLNCLVNPQNHPELLPGSWVGLPPTPPS